jgi:hypothetical protein
MHVLWRAAYAPGDGQTSSAYSSQPVHYLYINRYVTVNKVLSYLLLSLLPQYICSEAGICHVSQYFRNIVDKQINCQSVE